MVSTAVAFTSLPAACIGHKRPMSSSDAFFNPMRLSPKGPSSPSMKFSKRIIQVPCASLREKAVTGLSAAALTAAMLIPDVAAAAQPGISPSLKNFLLSIVAGGVVLGVLVGAVIGVANFDPVKRS